MYYHFKKLTKELEEHNNKPENSAENSFFHIKIFLHHGYTESSGTFWIKESYTNARITILKETSYREERAGLLIKQHVLYARIKKSQLPYLDKSIFVEKIDLDRYN